MIDKNKTYRTRDGREVRIYATDGGGKCPIHGAAKSSDGAWQQPTSWRPCGSWSWSTVPGSNDLIEVVPLIELWAVVRNEDRLVATTFTDPQLATNHLNRFCGKGWSIVHLREVIQ